MADNPFAASGDANARRIVAYGLRNPFRFTQRPGTDELWIGDVGWNTWEEINRLTAPTGTATRNFGWPCYEGASTQDGYQSAALTQCSSLSSTSVVAPYYTYNHGACVVAYTGCRTGGSSITGVAFYSGGSYPSGYNGALFFADHSRNEIWAMMPGANGLPDPAQIRSFVGVDATGGAAANPVDLEIGPGGDVFYVDMDGGKIHRIVYTAANQPPTARISASPTTGNAPLTVSFDGSGSTDPEGSALTYSWDLDGNGTFGDATGSTASYTPTSTVTWQVGSVINFSGHASDPQQGSLPASALAWKTIMHHCFTPTNCHTHDLQTFAGVSSGSFTAPDHEYPCWIELQLTATDSGGLTSTTSVRLDPRTVDLTFRTNPSGLKLTDLSVNGSPQQTTPFTVRVVVNSQNSVSAPSPQTQGRSTYYFRSWSDGGAQSHTITAPATATTYTATYRK